MAYKLIASDMDGTLLNSNNEITPETLSAVKDAIDKGVVFTLSTGRPVQGVKKYVNQLELDCPVITYNGAVVVHSRTGEVIFSQNMDNDDARKVYEQALKYNTMFIVWSQNKLYASEISEKSRFYENIVNTKAELLTDIDALIAQGITKFLWYHDAEILNEWKAELADAGFKCTTFTKSRDYFLEFFSAKTSKAVAMEKLGEYYGIDRTEMIAIGDQTNDTPMIEYAGLGVAMENAVESVKVVADYITVSNDENGVAEVIKKFVL